MKTAVALEYSEDCPAPFVVARGRGVLAERIEDEARKADVPVREDAALAEGLYPIEPGDFIPERYFRAVAAVLAAIWRMEGGKK